jgi:hypothetical protein
MHCGVVTPLQWFAPCPVSWYGAFFFFLCTVSDQILQSQDYSTGSKICAQLGFRPEALLGMCAGWPGFDLVIRKQNGLMQPLDGKVHSG